MGQSRHDLDARYFPLLEYLGKLPATPAKTAIKFSVAMNATISKERRSNAGKPAAGSGINPER
jgi:hypothetical protein